jgi:hypothetical protein
MSSNYDATEFIDGDFQAHKLAQGGGVSVAPERAPTREEVGSKVAEAQQKLAELKRAQEELERERSALEETRRRQHEFETGRKELIHNLTRGLGLLEEAEFNARREAEQMARTLIELREALSKIEAIQEQTWTKETFSVELTRALTILENARMEWNSARLKVPLLSGTSADAEPAERSVTNISGLVSAFSGQSFGQLCRLGVALTWPLAAVALLAAAGLLVVLLRH